VEYAAAKCPDIQLSALFTRRDPSAVRPMTASLPVIPLADAESMAGKLDVVIICGGSATDLPAMTPSLAGIFNVVDSFDTHANIPSHFDNVDKAARAGDKLALISCGWDPGLFSLMRVYAASVLPDGRDYTFWGRGVSQGHSDAVRRIEGVLDARQYTVPVPEAVESVRSGLSPELGTRQKHTRECYVVAAEGADKARIEREIKTMPNYFADYDTTVTFISAEEMARDHSGLPHGGFVIRNGKTGENTTQTMEFRLALGSNPEFTSSVLTAYARAVYRMSSEGKRGCITVLDVPPALLSPLTGEELRAHLL
ncbi:MAG: diaminopimelate dehydrogenase, partial [Oscillospiraceae bacterium]|nr:diaminopimelate dehydrogenase [Oscillospiraceae bacterium]